MKESVDTGLNYDILTPALNILMLVKKLSLSFLLSLALVFSTSVAADDDPVVAEVEGEEILLSRLKQHAKVMGQELDDDNYEVFLGQMVDAHLIATKSKRLRLQQEDDFKALQEYAYEQQLIRAYLEYLKREVDDVELDEAYKEWFEENPDYDLVNLQRISLDSREAAEEIVFMLQEGEPFDSLAARFSQDPLASQGGSLGEIPRRNLPGEIADVVFALDNDDYTLSPIPFGGKWLLFRVIGKGRAQIPSLDDVEDGLRSALATRKMKREAASMKLERSIKVYNMDGSPLE